MNAFYEDLMRELGHPDCGSECTNKASAEEFINAFIEQIQQVERRQASARVLAACEDVPVCSICLNAAHAARNGEQP